MNTLEQISVGGDLPPLNKPMQMKVYIATIKHAINEMDDLFFSMTKDEIGEVIPSFMAFQKWKEMKASEFEMRTIEKKVEWDKDTNTDEDGNVPPEARKIGFVH